MAKAWHELRDPIHGFIRIADDERRVIDSRPFQRLRHIHQLAMTYMVYPGATHRRFEHSLGVMELANRIFSSLTRRDKLLPQVMEILPELSTLEKSHQWWLSNLRMAALLHDIGHLPFSHAAEHLLPPKRSHETFTYELIRSEELSSLFKHMAPPPDPSMVAKLAVGPEKIPDTTEPYTLWETLLTEIITGDVFGSDRMDYLLRDSHHAGVTYGRFDHLRLIDSLRILHRPEDRYTPALGLELGGLQAAEGMLMARYFMYSQVYYHRVRRTYDRHLGEFLKHWLPDGKFPLNLDKHLQLTDNEVLAGINTASRDPTSPLHKIARSIAERKHYKVIYDWTKKELVHHANPVTAVYKAACEEFGSENVWHIEWAQGGSSHDFPVLLDNGDIVSSLQVSEVLRKIPPLKGEIVVVSPDIDKQQVDQWLAKNERKILGH